MKRKTKKPANQADETKDDTVQVHKVDTVEQSDESVFQLTWMLIKAIDKKINYKLLFFILLAFFIGYFTNLYRLQNINSNLVKTKLDEKNNNQNEKIINNENIKLAGSESETKTEETGTKKEIKKIEDVIEQEQVIEEKERKNDDNVEQNKDFKSQVDKETESKKQENTKTEKVVERNGDSKKESKLKENEVQKEKNVNKKPPVIEIPNDADTIIKLNNENQKKVIKEIKFDDIKVKDEKKPEKEDKQKPTKAPESKQNPSTKKNEISEEIENFKPTKINKIKTKKMWIPIPGSNGGHRRVPPIDVKAGKDHKSSVKLTLFEEFLSKEECDNLIKVHEDHVQTFNKQKPIICFDSVRTLRRHLNDLGKSKIAEVVTPNDFLDGTKCINQTFSRQLEKWGLKWSYSTAFYPGESKFSKVFGHRIEEATQLNETHGGKFQITSYPPGVSYKSHTDCSIDSNDERDRYATFLVYLNDLVEDEGGITNFTRLGIDVKPKAARALVWNSMNYETGKCEEASIHEASKVNTVTKKKYIIQRWYYYKNFYALGKRMPEPEIPKREPYTPRVSCDEYDSGSCRWYDEWNYDHLLEYMNRKHNLSY